MKPSMIHTALLGFALAFAVSHARAEDMTTPDSSETVRAALTVLNGAPFSLAMSTCTHMGSFTTCSGEHGSTTCSDMGTFSSCNGPDGSTTCTNMGAFSSCSGSSGSYTCTNMGSFSSCNN